MGAVVNRLAEAAEAVSRAAMAYESRWTLAALRRVDRELYELLVEQQGLYHRAMMDGDEEEVRIQSGAMCRGWAAAARRLEQAAVEDDAYVLGRDLKTGTLVAIGAQRHASARVREVHGERVIWVTPDEVAALIAGMELLKAAKEVFPNAEIIDLYPDEPAKEDAA